MRKYIDTFFFFFLSFPATADILGHHNDDICLQVRVNIPNSDMVGHTGDIEATVVACKAADEAVKVICFVNLCITWIRPAI